MPRSAIARTASIITAVQASTAGRLPRLARNTAAAPPSKKRATRAPEQGQETIPRRDGKTCHGGPIWSRSRKAFVAPADIHSPQPQHRPEAQHRAARAPQSARRDRPASSAAAAGVLPGCRPRAGPARTRPARSRQQVVILHEEKRIETRVTPATPPQVAPEVSHPSAVRGPHAASACATRRE